MSYRMPYTEASIKEAIRITPINPLGIARRCIADCTMGGYFIPKVNLLIECNYFTVIDDLITKICSLYHFATNSGVAIEEVE